MASDEAAQVLSRDWQGLWLTNALPLYYLTAPKHLPDRIWQLAEIKAQTGYKCRAGSYGGRPSVVKDGVRQAQLMVAWRRTPEKSVDPFGSGEPIHQQELGGNFAPPWSSAFLVPLCRCAAVQIAMTIRSLNASSTGSDFKDYGLDL